MKSKRILLVGSVVLLSLVLAHVGRDHWLPQKVADRLPNVPLLPESDDTSLKAGSTHPIRRIQVLKGDQFDIVFRDETRILARLSVRAAESAKPKVLDLLNHIDNPQVFLKSKEPDGQWVVDILFVHEQREINLADWLHENKLVYQ